MGGGSSRECTRCPTLVTVAPPTEAHAALWLQEGPRPQRQGVGSLDDDQQDLLRRDRSWSLRQEQEDSGGACRPAGYQGTKLFQRQVTRSPQSESWRWDW